MGLILNIETATTACSVALAKDGEVLALKEINEGYTHSENLILFIEDIMKQAGKKLGELDAVAVSKGPGSYTGLRIGVSAAKGFCFALEKPLIAVPTLLSMASSQLAINDQRSTINNLLVPMIDARRMEVYCAAYDQELNEIMPVQAKIIDESSFSELASGHSLALFGDGASKCKAVLENKRGFSFIDNVFPSAKDMAGLSEKAFAEKRFEDLAYFEPFYLKDFVGNQKA